MANILVAELNVYGKDKDMTNFINELKEYVDLTPRGEYKNVDGNVVQRSYEAEFRWNIEDTLTKPEVLALTEKYSVGVDAHGYEGGTGFYESVAVQFGLILQAHSWSIYIESAYFDPYQKNNTEV
jgi:hypothetical protein